MKKFLVSTASLAVLLGAMGTANAKEGDFSVYFSIGQGALYDTYAGGFFNAGPFNMELMAAKEIVQGIEVNGGFMFGVDTQETPIRDQNTTTQCMTVDAATCAKSRAKYIGFRPGIRIFLGDDRGQTMGGYLRLYLRAAFPIDISTQSASGDVPGRTYVNVGLLVGGGVEYRWKHVGIFGEVIVVPFFREFYMPVEGRVGIAAHF
jgi:hypothetical protein